MNGALMFVRYAYPPNSMGFCGPADSTGFRQYAEAGVVDGGLVRLAQAFSGAWPYLEMIAHGVGIADPLDRRVVEAYWVGNGLLDALPLGFLANTLEDRFRPRIGNRFGRLAEGLLAGGVPHHSFHVFGVYPWVGLLGDDRKADRALTVLDRCRIRWGQVTDVHGAQVTVRSRPLLWDGRTLSLGPPEPETADIAVDTPLQPGDWVSLHWNWVCDRLTSRQLRALHAYSARHVHMINHSAPLAALT
ncbi:DUF6390 family protein [Phytohabitans rumicis]|uniref:Uncharacterized protein n=1 Tax=Phytohabitans rumicis TaxID=1076125 RepID=A0A6V8LEW6_9ACTN|nr:DUF6390 family protein [Phytohabitans rumicis]GFJ94210.1 hypothetical protein Prum_078520 [Phytohabitans rumicis]